MKKFAVLFAALALVAMSAGTARADRGIWFHNISGSWATYFNLVNTSSTQTITATVSFYQMGSATSTTAVASTTKVMEPLDMWNFGTGTIGSTTSSSMDSYARGQWKSEANVAGALKGYGTQFQPTYNSGFNFRIPMNAIETD